MSSISGDSSGTVVYCNKVDEFKLDDVLQLLENIDESLLSKKTIQRPSGTQVFVYDYSDSVTKGESRTVFLFAASENSVCQPPLVCAT